MKFWKFLWKRFTFFLILLLTALLLTLLGVLGEKSIYSRYTLRPWTQPHLMLVLEGIHDGIYPWELLSYGQQDPGEENSLSAGSGRTEIAAEHRTGESAEAQTESAAAAGTEVRDTETAAAETSKEEEAKSLITGSADVLPEGVCNPVMQAVDYGVANISFLSPDDTLYNTDTEGSFARNGIYYRLQAVDSSYFEDALFIGDSRTVGLCEYGSLRGTAAFLAKESVNVYNLTSHELNYTGADGTTDARTAEEVLDEKEYGKIYIDLGVNELGIGTTEQFYEKYREILEMIREKQPDAILFIQGIMHVDKDLSSSDSARNNTVIVQRNEAIATLANGRDIFYIDMNPYVCDENGDLEEDLSGDGIHLKASAYENWDRSLMENAIVRTAEDWPGYSD